MARENKFVFAFFDQAPLNPGTYGKLEGFMSTAPAHLSSSTETEALEEEPNPKLKEFRESMLGGAPRCTWCSARLP